MTGMSMNYDDMVSRLLSAAKDAGLVEAEAYVAAGDSFRAASNNGEITDYAVYSTKGTSLRGMWQGHMGYSATECLDERSISLLISGVKESAELTEDEEAQDIYPGDSEYPEVECYYPQLEGVGEQEKLQMLLRMEESAKEVDPRIVQVSYNVILSSAGQVRILNTHGLDVSFKYNYCGGYVGPVAREGDKTATDFEGAFGHDFTALNLPEIAKKAANNALYALDRRSIPSGSYRAIIKNDTMSDLLEVFAGSFSAEDAQHGLSLLAGKVGQEIGRAHV